MTFLTQKQCLVFHAPLCINIIKSVYSPKTLGTCIDCVFRKENMFTGKDSILISISRKQWITLPSVLAHKLVTPLSTIEIRLALLHMSQPKLFSQLERCALSKTVYCHNGVYCQRIINNAVLQLSLFLCFQC